MTATTQDALAVHERSRDPVTFDVCGPLPTGTTVLEASAGTGKTFTIAALTARYVAEGHARLDQLLLVTFGRMASNELRTRVRERLVSLEAALAKDTPPGDAPSEGTLVGHAVADPDDAVARLLCEVDPAQRRVRRARVAQALTDFDTATIATTHEFCLQMLDGLGVLGDREPQAVFAEQIDGLTDEVATDVYLQRYAAIGQAPMRPEQARVVARAAVAAGQVRLVPSPAELTASHGGYADAAERVAYATAVRAEVERRKRAGRLFTYDDMLSRLRDTLADPRWGEVAAARLRQRYRVVLVDEFQDTDPVQWEILDRAFSGARTMVLIGDPKQAVYGFRGADVFSYLDAVGAAETVSTLDTNRRSDAALVAAFEALLGGAALGEEQIVVRPVGAHHQTRRLTCPADPERATPLRIRVWPHPAGAKPERVGTLRPAVRDDLVADVSRLLGGAVTLERGGSGGPRPVRPDDVAVLVRTNRAGEDLRDRLVGAGIPAVMHAARSVFDSSAAADWLTVLTALEQPRQAQVRRAALTCFFGWNVRRLALASEQDLAEATQRVRAWRRILLSRGMAALTEAVLVDEHVPERLLARRGGSRTLTDVRHVAERLHAAMTARQLGIGASVEWLAQRIAEAHRDAGADGSRRLETDAEAVSVVTVHRSKGLEYPIVYLPDAWEGGGGDADDGQVLTLHEPNGAGVERVLDVGGRTAPGRAQRFRRSLDEAAGEDLRLLYVALTRAGCQVVTWWAPGFNTSASALQRILHRPDTGMPARAYPLADGDPLPDGRDLGPHVSVEPYRPRKPVGWHPPAEPGPTLSVRSFTRTLDLAWRRTSYSALTAAAHGLNLDLPAVGSEPEVAEDDEALLSADPTGTSTVPTTEPTRPEPVDSASATGLGWDAVSPMAELPSGTEFGTAVHAVLETVDPGADDLAAALGVACAEVLARTGGQGFTPQALAEALTPTFSTPLGPLAEQRTLAAFGQRDRLAELDFELPLAGGDAETRTDLTLGALVPLLRRHLCATDPLAGYPDRLAHPLLADQPLRGYLTGSVDAVLRLRSADAPPRYLVVDYKTNWLGPHDADPLTLAPYAPPRLAEVMMAAHYPLQALLYAVAVHRMLRWRQPGYDPATHLGGVLYLFVRGLAGSEPPRVDDVPAGVFSWRPPAALVTQLSDLLAGDPVPERTA